MRITKTAFAGLGLLLLTGCGSLASETPRLRVRNGGRAPIVNLTVIFPEDRIGFGDIAAGATTTYRDVPNGVYRYARHGLRS